MKILLGLKAEFKTATGHDWKPSVVIETSNTTETKTQPQGSNEISEKITTQGNKVRQLKEVKASKEAITAEVNILLDLKKDFKNLTGQDWKPEGNKPVTVDSNLISEKISLQGEKVRELKSNKANKSTITTEVNILLDLKAEYKTLTGEEWKSLTTPTTKHTSTPPTTKLTPQDVNAKIVKQGDKVRELKSSKANKSVIDQEVKTLLALKEEYKALTGENWKPDLHTSSVLDNSVSVVENLSTSMSGNTVEELTAKVNEQGNIVRQLKSNSASKVIISFLVLISCPTFLCFIQIYN